MTRSKTISSALILLSVLLVSACGKDPEVLKREYVKSGDDYVAQKKFAEAAIQYRNAVQQDPRFGEARRKLAEAYMAVGDTAGAYREMVRAADLLKDDKVVQVRAGEMLLLARQYPEAAARAEKALALDPKFIDAQILKANALAGLNKMEDAIAEVEEAIKNDPERIASYTSLGTMQFIRGERRAAEGAFRKAIDIDPKSIGARLALANYLWVAGQRNEAETHLRAALGIDPKNALANRAMIIFFIGSGRAAEAEPYLKALTEVIPGTTGQLKLADYYLGLRRVNDARQILEKLAAEGKEGFVAAKLKLAALNMLSGDRVGAMKIVEEVLAKEPRSAEGLLAKGYLLTAEGKLDEALQTFLSAAMADPTAARVQYALGEIRARRREDAEAITAFTQALTLNPRMAPAEVALARLNLQANRLDEAESFAQAAITKVAGYAEAHLVLAKVNLRRRNVTKAEPSVRALAKVLPNLPSVQTALGELEMLKNNRAAARQAFEKALASNPAEFDALTGLVRIDFQDKRTEAAMSRLAAARQRVPKDSAVLLLTAAAYSTLKDQKHAEQFAREAVEADTNNVDAYGLLGRLYVEQRRLDQAITLYTHLATKRPDAIGPPTMVGMLLEMQNKPAEARKHYERALAIDPRAAVAANNLAWLQTEDGGNLDIALELAKTAKSQLPDRPEVNDTLGWVYYKKGLLSMAVQPLLESIGKDPKNPSYHYHLGLVYAAIGDNAKARTSLERSLEIDGKFDHAAQAKQALAALKS